MFKDLLPILEQTGLLMAISKNDDKVVVSIVPRSLDNDKKTYPPATIIGTAEELDATFPKELEKLRISLSKLKAPAQLNTEELDKTIEEETKPNAKPAAKGKTLVPTKKTEAKPAAPTREELIESISDHLKAKFRSVETNMEKKFYTAAKGALEVLAKQVKEAPLKSFFKELIEECDAEIKKNYELDLGEQPKESKKITPNPVAVEPVSESEAEMSTEEEELFAEEGESEETELEETEENEEENLFN